MKITFLFSIALLIQSLSFSTLNAQKVAETVNEVRGPEVGSAVPDVSLIDISGATTSLTNLLGNKKAVIVLYRGGWCPYCTAQMAGLAKAKDEVLALGYQIIGVTGEDVTKTSKFSEDKELPYKIFSDNGSMLAKKLGVAYKVDQETLTKYKGYGIDIPEGILPVPTLLVVNEKGNMSYVYANPDHTVRISSEELLKVLNSQTSVDTE